MRMRAQKNLNPRVRQARIAEMVREQGSVTVDTLVERFGTSHETIRRDLTELAKAGRIDKVHGGAKLPNLREEGPFRQRMATNEPGKREIAAKVMRLVDPGDTLLIDTGSTTLFCAEEIARLEQITVITNSTAIAAAIAEGGRSAAIYLVGGTYDGDNRETVGPMAIGQLNTFHGDHAIISAAAVDSGSGIMDLNFDEAQVGRAMIGLADNVIVVADASKFDRRAPFAVCGLDRIHHLVSDRPPEGELAKALADAQVHVH